MLDGAEHHTVTLDGSGVDDGRSVVAFFARQVLKDLRLVGGYEVLYGQVKTFVRERLFQGPPVDIDDAVVLRNLSDSAAAARILGSFKTAINALTVQDTGASRIEDFIRLRDLGPFRTQHREELDLSRKMARLGPWCEDAAAASRQQYGPDAPRYGFVYVDQAGFDRHPPATWAELLSIFREYQAGA